jgi:hypothetical protein
MIEIRYSAPASLEISGSVGDLQLVRQETLRLVRSRVSQIVLDADASIDPAPYVSALSTLVIEKEDGPARVRVANREEIHVAGSPGCLEAFASFFDFHDDAESGAHSHHEYYDGNKWVAPDSIPLVVRLK